MSSREPESLIELAIEAKSGASCEKLRAALAKLAEQDSSFDFACDQESGQFIIRGVSEEQLDEKITTLKNICTVECNIGQPQVAYRETITLAADIDHTHTKIRGPTSAFARVKFRASPLDRGAGYHFENQITDGALRREFIEGFEQGIGSIRNTGLLVGFPIIDFKIALYDGAYHDENSTPIVFEQAARRALRENKSDLGLVLLEPNMKVKVETPLSCIDPVISDLHKRRGVISDRDISGNKALLHAEAPLGNMFGYVNTLRALTDGDGSYEMEFSHYKRVPRNDGNDL